MKHTILVFVAAFSLLQCRNDSSADSGNPAPNALNATQKPIDPNVGGVGQVRNTDATQIKGLMLMNAGKGGVMDYVNKVIYMIEDPQRIPWSLPITKQWAPCHYPVKQLMQYCQENLSMLENQAILFFKSAK